MLALHTFMRNLPHNYLELLRQKDIKTLDDAVKKIIEEEQFRSYLRSFPTSNNQSNSKPFPQQVRPTVGQTTRFNFPSPFPTQPSNTFGQPNIPGTSSPFNLQPRLIRTKFPTNQQVFGKPKTQNVWKPTNQPPTSKPTPMSGITATKQVPYRPNQYGQGFQAQSRPTFHSEELFQISNEPVEEYTYQEPYTDPNEYHDQHENVENTESDYFESENTNLNTLFCEPNENFSQPPPSDCPR